VILKRVLSPLAADPPGQLNVLGHNGHALGVDGAQVGVLEQTNKVCLCSLLEGKDGMALETQISLHRTRTGQSSTHRDHYKMH
jgi:hypothetical protein